MKTLRFNMIGLKRYFPLAALLACLLLAVACKPDALITTYASGQRPAEGQEQWADLPLTLAPATEEGGTKASLLKDVEARGSGALVLVYRSDTRQFVTSRFFRQDELDNQTAVPLRVRVPLAVCDFYILGNLNAISKADGAAVNLLDALDASFPMEEDALETMVYRLDGGDLIGGFRRETFADVAALGIPYALIKKDVNTASLVGSGQGLPDANRCCRLFSKVTVRIDHGAFDGCGANPEFFVNSRLYLLQANARLQPFSDAPQKAVEAADVLSQSDYDPDMQSTSASVTSFSFYVPENRQGTLLTGNSDGRRKTRDELITRGLSAVEPYLTYVEFCGRLDPAAGGYGGDVTYRFYLGRDNCADFDLERGREYKVSLSFRVGSLFESDWRVEPSLTDSRTFALTADASFTTDIGAVNDSRLVAVRKTRPGAFYLYMNPVGTLGGTNLLLGKDASATTDFSPGSLSDCSWYGAFLQAGTEDANWLADHGISASWEKASGRLAFSVTDAAKFEARKADPARTFTLRLLPGGSLTASFRLALCDDLRVSVADGKSLTDEFYLGQKRTVTVSGFSGHTVKYAAIQPDCGGKSGNRMWKTSSGAAAPFPDCARDAAGHPVLDVHHAAYAAQTYLGALDVYAFYPNRFQPGHGWESRPGKIVFFTEDWLNDALELDVRISEPYLKRMEATQDLVLPLDGTPQAVPEFGYMDYSGSSLLDLDSFDGTLYNSLLSFERTTSGAYAECIGVDLRTLKAYCRQTTYSGGGDLLALSYDSRGVTDLGAGRTLYLQANTSTGLYSGRVFKQSCQYSKLVLKRISAVSYKSDWTYTGGTYGDYVEGTVITVDNYFKGASYNLRDTHPFTENSKMTFMNEYNFVGSDLATLKVVCDGGYSPYTSSHGETFGPVWDVELVSADTGSKGELALTFDEAHQVMQDSYGEPVPGGLIIPYSQQHLRYKMSNRWDGRQFETTGRFTITYDAEYFVFVGATRSRYAEVHLVTPKQLKYLYLISSKLNKNGRTYCTKFLGSSVGSEYYVHAAYAYLDNKFYMAGMVYSNRNYFRKYTSTTRLPLKDFDASYVNYSTSTTQWSSSLMYSLLHGNLPIKPGKTAQSVSRSNSDLMYLVSFGELEGSPTPEINQNQLRKWATNTTSDVNNCFGSDWLTGVYVDVAEGFTN